MREDIDHRNGHPTDPGIVNANNAKPHWDLERSVTTCSHCNIPITHRPSNNVEYCSWYCKKALDNIKMMCPECNFRCKLVGRLKSHFDKEHSAEWYETVASCEVHYDCGCDGFTYGSGWNENKKQQVRERDGYYCQSCGKPQHKHQSENDEKLHVHHLIKARDIDDPEQRNAMKNLITLCRGCHREWERISEAGIRPQVTNNSVG